MTNTTNATVYNYSTGTAEIRTFKTPIGWSASYANSATGVYVSKHFRFRQGRNSAESWLLTIANRDGLAFVAA